MSDKASVLTMIGLLALGACFIIGYRYGLDDRRAASQITCIGDKFTVIDKPECYIDAINVVSGMPDGETGWIKMFDQVGVCGSYACKGQAQGTYECFERNKLKPDGQR